MSDSNRGRKRQAPTKSPNHSEPNEDASADDPSSVPGTATYDGSLSKISKTPRRRKRFNPQRRAEVAKIRKIGACRACKARKVGCTHVLQRPDGHLDSAPPAPKPSPQTYPFEFESSYPAIVLEGDAGQWPQSHEGEPLDPSDGSDLIATVPALMARRERLALDLHDFENVIEDDSRGSTVKSVLNTPSWGQNSPWMISAMALTNNQQYLQPSTAYPYSNTNMSIDVGPSLSTPASSSPVLSSNTQDMGIYWCNVHSCDNPQRFLQPIDLWRHQEIEHADIYPPIVTYACPVEGCNVKRFRKEEYLHMHVTCQHPERLESPMQLPPSNVSKRDTRPDRLAQIEKFLAGEYLPGIENNPIVSPDRTASGEIDSHKFSNWQRARSSRGGDPRRFHSKSVPGFHQKPGVWRPNSQMRRQVSARTVDDSAHKLQGQFNTTSSNLGIGSTATYLNILSQRPEPGNQHVVERMSNLGEQHWENQSQLQHVNSPTTSLAGQFAHNMQISDRSHVFQTTSEIGEEVLKPAVQRDHMGIFGTTHIVPPRTSTALNRNWAPQNQLVNASNPHTLNSYEDLGFTQTEVTPQSGYNCSDMWVPALSRQDSSASIARTGGFNNGATPPSFQTDTRDQQPRGPMNDGSPPSFYVPRATKHPTITLNDRLMLNTGQDADFTSAPNSFSSDPMFSQRNSPPYLDFGTLSSSGASESLVSPVQALNLFNDKYGDDWDGSSSFFNDFNNMEMNTNDEVT